MYFVNELPGHSLLLHIMNARSALTIMDLWERQFFLTIFIYNGG